MKLVGTRDDPEPEWVLAALQKHEAALLRYAASLVGETRAQDVVQDTFLRLCSQPVESVQDHLAAWLFTVCRNRAREIRRADRRVAVIQDVEEKDDMRESPDSGPIAKLERAEDLSRVAQAMAALPKKQREALRLKVEAGLSYKDIAEVMNLSVGNVGFILHQAIARVRESLSEQDEAPRRAGSTP
ncbi:MAG TPA: sigma-70 family RNA polymerase sigma factor [Polyangiaceae bacterium]|nr:sigma-70 family RNA polymerase sigma factor [Polyangiaceae bacterium]